jgi:TP901 family phage tail tape measure protein
LAVVAAQLMVKVGADTSAAERGLTNLDSKITSFAGGAAKTGALLSAGLTAPLAAVGKFAADQLIPYQQAMDLLQVNTKASTAEMATFAAKAKELGADVRLPATSAGDAAQAMLALSKAGMSVNDTLAASRGVLQLAAAGKLDEARAAEIAANALNSFKLAGTEATAVADLLAAAASSSSVEVEHVADSFKMASAVFSAFQSPAVGSKNAMVDLTTAIGLLGNAGIKGSDAGTSLKQMLLQLTGPSDKAKGMMRELAQNIGASGDIAFDAQGRMRSLKEIVDLTARATAGLTEEKRNEYLTDIFGADASRAMIVLMREGVAGWDAMREAVTRQGAASDLASAQMKGLGGALAGLQSTLETIALDAAESVSGMLEGMVRGATDLVGRLGQLDPNLRNAGIAFGVVLAAAGPVLLLLGGLAAAFGFVLSPVGLLVVGVAALAAAFAGDFGGIRSAVMPLLGQLQAGLGIARDAVLTFIGAIGGSWQPGPGVAAFHRQVGEIGLFIRTTVIPALQALGGILGRIFSGDLVGGGRALLTYIRTFGPAILGQLSAWGRQFVAWVAPHIPPMLAEAQRLGQQLLAWVQAQVLPIFAALGRWGHQFASWLLPQIPALLAQLAGLGGQLLGWLSQQASTILAQLQAWGQQFVAWVGPMIPPFLAQLGAIAGAIGQWLLVQASGIGQQLLAWGAAFLAWIGPMIPPFLAQLAMIATGLFAWVVGQVPAIAAQLLAWGQAFLAWIGPMVSPLLAQLGGIAQSVLGWIVANGPALARAFVTEWVPGAINWVLQAANEALPHLLRFIGQVLDWVTVNGPPLAQKFLAEWVPAVIGWVAEAAILILPGLALLAATLIGWVAEAAIKIAPELAKFVGTIASWVVTDGVPKVVTLAIELGKAVVTGIVQGIGATAGTVGAKVVELVQSAFQAGKNWLESRSPSRRAARELGAPIPEGAALGVESGAGRLNAALAGVLGGALRRAGDAVRAFRDVTAGAMATASARAEAETLKIVAVLGGPAVEAYKAAKAELDAYDAALGELGAEIAAQQAVLKRHEEALKPLQAAYDAAARKVEGLKSVLGSLNSELSRLGGGGYALPGEREANSEIFNMQNAIDDLRRQRAQMIVDGADDDDERVKAIDKEIAEHQKVLDLLQARKKLEIDNKRQILSDATDQRLTVPFEAQLRMIGAVKERINEIATKELPLAEAAQAEVEKRLVEQKRLIEDQKALVGDLQQLYDGLKERAEGYRRELERSVDAARDLNQELEKARRERGRLREEEAAGGGSGEAGAASATRGARAGLAAGGPTTLNATINIDARGSGGDPRAVGRAASDGLAALARANLVGSAP